MAPLFVVAKKRRMFCKIKNLTVHKRGGGRVGGEYGTISHLRHIRIWGPLFHVLTIAKNILPFDFFQIFVTKFVIKRHKTIGTCVTMTNEN